MLVGMAIVIYNAENETPWGFVLVAFAGCIGTRAMQIFPLAFLLNRVRKDSKRISWRFQLVMWFAGLRGAIAVALAVQMPGPHKGQLVVVTVLVVVATIFLLGGSSKALLDRLQIQTSEPQGLDRELSNLSRRSHRRLRTEINDLGTDADELNGSAAATSGVDAVGRSECKRLGVWMRQLEQRCILDFVVDRTIPGHHDAWERKNRHVLGSDSATTSTTGGSDSSVRGHMESCAEMQMVNLADAQPDHQADDEGTVIS